MKALLSPTQLLQFSWLIPPRAVCTGSAQETELVGLAANTADTTALTIAHTRTTQTCPLCLEYYTNQTPAQWSDAMHHRSQHSCVKRSVAQLQGWVTFLCHSTAAVREVPLTLSLFGLEQQEACCHDSHTPECTCCGTAVLGVVSYCGRQQLPDRYVHHHACHECKDDAECQLRPTGSKRHSRKQGLSQHMAAGCESGAVMVHVAGQVAEVDRSTWVILPCRSLMSTAQPMRPCLPSCPRQPGTTGPHWRLDTVLLTCRCC